MSEDFIPTPPQPRLNKSNNNGGAFQTRLELTLLGYKDQGRADLEKVDPPVKVLGGGKFRKVIFQKNPWLDYVGTWTEQGGRMLLLEAKSTQDERLPIYVKSGGVTEEQVKSLLRWHSAGAAAAVVWGHANEMRLVTAREIEQALGAGARSIQWRHVPAIHRGTGLIEFDVLAELAQRY